MIFDTFTIVCSLVALFILFLAWLFNPFRRRIFNAEANEDATDNPPVSLVIITQGPSIGGKFPIMVNSTV